MNPEGDAAEPHHESSDADKQVGVQNEKRSHKDGDKKTKMDPGRRAQKGHPGQDSNQGPQPQRYYGLRNQGATCYLNSVLQVLFMTPELHDSLNPGSKTDLQLKNIIEELKNKVCETKTITDTFGIKDVYRQDDAAECLVKILCNISEQASEVFKGELTVRIKCSEDHIINQETNPFWNLQLPLSKDPQDKNYSVKTRFDEFFKLKSFSGENMLDCKECDKETKPKKECEMTKDPQILTLLLKRFDFNNRTSSLVKSDCCVDVPPTLQTKKKEYELYAIVNHHGSTRGGHYTATIKGKKIWYKFNDTDVKEVEHQPYAISSNQYKSSSAYLLMYRAIKGRNDLEDKMTEQQDAEENQELQESEAREGQGEEVHQEGMQTDDQQRGRGYDNHGSAKVSSFHYNRGSSYTTGHDNKSQWHSSTTTQHSDQHSNQILYAEDQDRAQPASVQQRTRSAQLQGQGSPSTTKYSFSSPLNTGEEVHQEGMQTDDQQRGRGYDNHGSAKVFYHNSSHFI